MPETKTTFETAVDITLRIGILLLLIAWCFQILYPFFSIYRAWRGSTKLEEARALFLAWTVLFAFLAMLTVLTKTSEEYDD